MARPVIQREIESMLGEETEKGRYRCPFCDTRRGMSPDFESGDTGVLHCFGCDWRGTGAHLRAEIVYGDRSRQSVAKALEDFGLDHDPDEVDDAVRQHERTQDIVQEEKEEDPLVEIERAKERMTEEERNRYLAYLSMLRGEYYVRYAGKTNPLNICSCILAGRVEWYDSDPYAYYRDTDNPHRLLSMRITLSEETRKWLEGKIDELINRALDRPHPPGDPTRDLRRSFLSEDV